MSLMMGVIQITLQDASVYNTFALTELLIYFTTTVQSVAFQTTDLNLGKAVYIMSRLAGVQSRQVPGVSHVEYWQHLIAFHRMRWASSAILHFNI